MKNYWKQFTGLATGSRDNTIFRTRKGLTLVFFLSVFLILLISHILRSYTILSADFGNFNGYPGSNLVLRLISGTWLDLVRSGIAENLIMALFLLIIGWFIIGKLLQPVKDIQESQKLFMADAAHELFTPLSVMKTNTEVALMDGQFLSTQIATETLHGVLEEIDRMTNIIKNLMKLSSKSQIPFTKINLSVVVERVIRLLEPLAQGKNIKVEFLKDDSAVMWGSETALEEMVTNLLKNSIQHSSLGGVVKICVADNTPNDIEFRIQDKGVGISQRDLRRIFEPFYRGGSGISAARSGSGLGLSIVQEIVKLHNGSIKIRSTEGKGTIVDVKFSLA